MDSNGNKCTPIFQRNSQANESQENSAETSFQWQNFLEDSPYNFQEDVNYPPSLTIPSQGKNKGLIGDNSVSSNSTSSVQGHNPRGQENASCGKGKEPMEEGGRAPREKTNETFCHRSSMYRGVTRYGNNISEAFQWDNCNTKKPKTGGFNSEEEAAPAHYLAALKCGGESIATHSHLSNDEDDLKELTRKEYLKSIKRKRKGISKGSTSKYRGVCKNSHMKKWQARLGRGRGIRCIYLGSFSSEEEAARAYDIAAIRLKGFKATTNFDLSQYNVQSILESEKFPIGKGVSSFLKNEKVEDVIKKRRDARIRIFTSSNENSSIFRPVNNNPQMQMIPVPTPNPSTKLSHKNSTNQVLHPNPNSIFSETHNGPMFQRNPNWFHGSSSCMGNGMETDYQENSLGRFCTRRQAAVPRFEQFPNSLASNLFPNQVMQQSRSSFYPVGYQSPSHIHSNPTTFLEDLTGFGNGPKADEGSSKFFNREVEGVDDFLDGSCNGYQNPSCCSIGNKGGFIENNKDGAEDWDSDIDIENLDIDPNFLRDFFSDEP